MAQSSFDIVSQVDLQEVNNAVDQAQREIQTRYDFKGSESEIRFDKEKLALNLVSDDESRLSTVIDVLLTKLLKRSVPVKSLLYGKTEPTGRLVKKEIQVQQGISKDQAREVNQFIKKMKIKVQSQVMGEQIRVTGKSRDDLQRVIAELKGHDFDFDLQFTNYR